MNVICSRLVLIHILATQTANGKDMPAMTKIIDFGKPMNLQCATTNETKFVSWWKMGPNSNLKRLSDSTEIAFSQVNHSHSGVYECFDSYGGSKNYIKHTWNVFVVEIQCFKKPHMDPMNKRNVEDIFTSYRIWHVDIPFKRLDVCLKCDGSIKQVQMSKITVNEMELITVTPTDPDECRGELSLLLDGLELSCMGNGSGGRPHLEAVVRPDVTSTREAKGIMSRDVPARASQGHFTVVVLTILCTGVMVFFICSFTICYAKSLKAKMRKMKMSPPTKSYSLKLDLREDEEPAQYELLKPVRATIDPPDNTNTVYDEIQEDAPGVKEFEAGSSSRYERLHVT